MPRKPVPPINFNKPFSPKDDEIESSPYISQDQLKNARIFSSREEYAKNLPKGISFLEVGVAWGYSAEMFIEGSSASKSDLLDLYDQDLKCWSWRKFGECKCDGFKHELLYTPETHEQYIKDKFKKYGSRTIKGDALQILEHMNDIYDFIYIDISNDRFATKRALNLASKLTKTGSVIGLNDYLIYDGIIEDVPYGTFQTVNEFLYNNKNWEVDALALHPLGFYDIYIKRVKNV